jgi:hypothetical protein
MRDESGVFALVFVRRSRCVGGDESRAVLGGHFLVIVRGCHAAIAHGHDREINKSERNACRRRGPPWNRDGRAGEADHGQGSRLRLCRERSRRRGWSRLRLSGGRLPDVRLSNRWRWSLCVFAR